MDDDLPNRGLEATHDWLLGAKATNHYCPRLQRAQGDSNFNHTSINLNHDLMILN